MFLGSSFWKSSLSQKQWLPANVEVDKISMKLFILEPTIYLQPQTLYVSSKDANAKL